MLMPMYGVVLVPFYFVNRRPNKDEKDEELSPCPFCSEMLPITDLDCPSCKNSIPYCIVTGGHMTLDNWSYCPSCRFPALHSKFGQYLERNAGKHLAATTAVSTQQQSSPSDTHPQLAQCVTKPSLPRLSPRLTMLLTCSRP